MALCESLHTHLNALNVLIPKGSSFEGFLALLGVGCGSVELFNLFLQVLSAVSRRALDPTELPLDTQGRIRPYSILSTISLIHFTRPSLNLVALEWALMKTPPPR